MTIVYAQEQDLPVADYVTVLGSTYMGSRRPIGNSARVARMLKGSNMIVTARDEAGEIVGLARGISDGEWVCYLADLVVRDTHQRRGIGQGLMAAMKKILGPGMGIVLMAYPEAVAFYRKAGLGEMAAFFVDREVRD